MKDQDKQVLSLISGIYDSVSVGLPDGIKNRKA